MLLRVARAKRMLSSYISVKEGISDILIPKDGVFYNPVQEFNRDLSVAVIRQFEKNYSAEHLAKKKPQNGLVLLDALTASGFRAVRYAHQIPNLKKVVSNDLDPSVRETIQANLERNSIPSSLVEISTSDANALMYSRTKKEPFDVIDIDPYGTASPFLDAAVQAIADGGLLCVTSTDLAVLCGVHPETCFAKYQGLPIHNEYCHEAAIRLLLSSIETAANKYSRCIQPLMSCYIDFYVRVFVRIHESAQKVKHSITKKSLVFNCKNCHSFFLQPFGTNTASGSFKFHYSNLTLRETKCSICQGNLQVGGPMWSAELHDFNFIESLLQSLAPDEPSLPLYGTVDRMRGFVKLLHEEAPTPLFMTLDKMSQALKCSTPPIAAIRSALLHANYSVSSSHCNPLAIKTNASMPFLWTVLLEWSKANSPIKSSGFPNDSLSYRIFSNEELFSDTIDFSIHESCVPDSKAKGLLRYHVPPPGWGPKPRAKKAKKDVHASDPS